MTERLLLIRHGESTWNAEERWQGWADCPLSARGRAQAVEAAAVLGEMGVDGSGLSAVVSSDLVRARDTADIVARGLGLKPAGTERGLREYDVGDWCGLTRDEIEARWPGVRDKWREGRLEALPGGETRQAFTARVIGAVEELGARGDLGRAALVVTHGGVIRLLERHLDADSEPVPNLGGRWLRCRGQGGLELGERVELLATPTESPTP